MIHRLIAGAKRTLGLHHPGRNVRVFPDDTFLVSYPKSGNTWTRFLVGNLVHPEPAADFSNINIIIPDPEAFSKNRMAKVTRPRIIKSHQYFDPRYRRVIYIVRDPRDVALSQYHFHRKRKVIGDDSPLEAFIARFITGETSVYGSWGENVASWLSTRGNDPGFLLLRYEDMMKDALRELARVADFLGIEAGAERLQLAVERSSSDNMRKLEKEQGHLWSSTRETRSDIPFVRVAKAGGWKQEMPEGCVMQLENAWSPLMRHLGYETSLSRNADALSANFSEVVLNGPAR